MSVIRPFKAVRPKNEYASKVAALPYDVMNSEEAREAVKGKPYSFIHVDKAEVDLPPDTYIYDEKVYIKAKENLEKLKNDGVLTKDKKPLLYVYRQVMDGRVQTGLVGCASIDDYLNNVIKKHELTREDKERDRINHVDYCDANTGPIFLTYKGNREIDDIINKYVKKEPWCDFLSDNVKNAAWVIDDERDIEKLVNLFKKVPCLYIADGHHRAASAVKVGLKRREKFPSYDGTEEFNYFLAVYFKSEDLSIMDYNRVIADLNELTEDEIIEKISEKFYIKKAETAPYRPESKHTFGMYLKKEWYKLKAKDGSFNEDDPVENLDVSILQNNIIESVFGISDPRTDARIDFVGGIRGLSELERRCETDMKAAFSLYPTSIDDLMAIADAGKTMPPKSTWFEPKLLSGLFIHELS